MGWEFALGPKPHSKVMRRALDPGDDYHEMIKPCASNETQSFNDFVQQNPERLSERPKGRIYLLGLGSLADEADPSTPSLSNLMQLLTAYLGVPVDSIAAPPAVRFLTCQTDPRSGRRELPAGQLFEILSRVYPVDAHCMLVLTLDSVLPGPCDPSKPCAITDVSAAVASLRHLFDAVAPLPLALMGISPCRWFLCLHNHQSVAALPVANCLCPVCLRKLQHTVGFDICGRYNQLQSEYSRAEGFEDVMAWISQRMRFLSTDGPNLGAPASESSDVVEALFSNGEWYPARITQRMPNGSYDVLFDDGITLCGLGSDQVRSSGATAGDSWGQQAGAVQRPAYEKQQRWEGGEGLPHEKQQSLSSLKKQQSLSSLKAKHKMPPRKSHQSAEIRSLDVNRELQKGGAGDCAGRSSWTLPQYRTALRLFYEEHQPDKAKNIEMLLTKFAGREEQLLRSLEKKYQLPKGSFDDYLQLN